MLAKADRHLGSFIFFERRPYELWILLTYRDIEISGTILLFECDDYMKSIFKTPLIPEIKHL